MMNWYQDIRLAQMIVEEKIAPKQHKEYRPPVRFGARMLRPLLRALMGWLF